jgi:hypothetical protein
MMGGKTNPIKLTVIARREKAKRQSRLIFVGMRFEKTT